MEKIILVTGANRGIGKETCRQLAAQGHQLIMGSRDLEKGKQAASEIEGKVEAIQLDVTSDDSIEMAVAKISVRFGRLDVLINNAGVFSEADVLTVSTEEMNRVFETNVYAPLRVAQLMKPLLDNSDDPRIVNVSSAMGQMQDLFPNAAAYRLSKFALNGVTIQLENTLHNMKVNAMHPGWVRTDMGGEQAPLSVEEGADTAVWLATSDDVKSGCFYGERTVKGW